MLSVYNLMTPRGDVKETEYPVPSSFPLTSMYENLQQPLKMQKNMKGPFQSQGLVCPFLATVETWWCSVVILQE